jgi:hypothetical protein
MHREDVHSKNRAVEVSLDLLKTNVNIHKIHKRKKRRKRLDDCVHTINQHTVI